MRSFAKRNPMVEEGTYGERCFGVFCQWVTAVAHLADNVINEEQQKLFDTTQWRTCRPWLSYNDLHSSYTKFLRISLGTMQCGNTTLGNDQVAALVYFERKMTTNRHDSDNITDIILSLYTRTSTRRTARTVVFRDVNTELIRRGLVPLLDNTREWLCALQALGDPSRENNYHVLYLERILPSAKQIEDVLLLYYVEAAEAAEAADTDPFQEISEYFRVRKIPFTRNSLAWISVANKYPNLQRIPFDLQTHIDQWFVKAIPGQTKCRRSEVIDVVNFSLTTPIEPESIMWTHCIGDKDRVNLNRKTHVDYRRILDQHFEISEIPKPLLKLIHQVRPYAPVVQVPFLLRAMTCKAGFRAGDVEVHLRKKQRVNWTWVARTYLAPGQGLGVVSFCNFWLKHHGYETYHDTSQVWAFTKNMRLRRDVVHAMALIREKQPEAFLKPPQQLKTIVGKRKVVRIYDPYVIEDAPTPKHPKRTRLLLNRTYQWALHSKSMEWKWAMSIRKESESRKPRRGATQIKNADEYDSNEFMLNN
jgi:hypothetical protein